MEAMKASKLTLAAGRGGRATGNASCISPALAAKGHIIDGVAYEVTGCRPCGSHAAPASRSSIRLRAGCVQASRLGDRQLGSGRL